MKKNSKKVINAKVVKFDHLTDSYLVKSDNGVFYNCDSGDALNKAFTGMAVHFFQDDVIVSGIDTPGKVCLWAYVWGDK